ncbi:ATP-binding protein [Meridianimarinicoccus aquatilis]|nr:ATP-binding protein [Fluviibacterium aquatile]QIE43204.1 ATP-binding protein [Rhodobacteraceae bacterium SC52]
MTFSMAAKIDDVDPMVLQLKAIAETVLDPDRVVAFEIAISEALTNVVRHGMIGREDESVAIDLQPKDDGLVVVISETGTPVPPELIANISDLDDLDQFAESGRGIALIKACADSLEYASENGINRLFLRFSNSTELEK